MCTLTIIPLKADSQRSPSSTGRRATGVRIACNRDESRLRPTATPPELRRFGDRQAWMPIDPAGGGTWIAASDAPLALVLMNVYTEPIESRASAITTRNGPRVSRGTIIPHVLAAGTLDEALLRATDLNLGQFEPFRLVIADREQYSEVVWAMGQFSVADPAAIREPLFFTTSGLGDEVVAGPRRRLFENVIAADVDRIAAQDAFHRHVWPGKEYASVWMTRPEACTVSLTVVELFSEEVRMRYSARDSDESGAQDYQEAALPVVAGQADVTS